jgi:hypothetical protein
MQRAASPLDKQAASLSYAKALKENLKIRR